MKKKLNINFIKEKLSDSIGKEVTIKEDIGRNRSVITKGIIVKTFPNVFTIKILGSLCLNKLESYSYSDVLTSTIKIKLI